MLTPATIQETLVIDDLLVPASVTIKNLENYDKDFLGVIESVYQQIKAEQMAKCAANQDMPASSCIVLAGSHGTGKSHLANQIMNELNIGYVVCDADDIMTKFPEFENLHRTNRMYSQIAYQGNIGNFFNAQGEENKNQIHPIDAMKEEIEYAVKATRQFRPAAKYISDRLHAECIREGIPVIVETTATSPHIGEWLKNIAAQTGDTLEVIIAQAPLSIKKAASKDHFMQTHDVAVSDEDLDREHADNMKNMATLAKAPIVTIYWRQDKDSSLKDIARATKKDFTHVSPGYEAFNAYFMDHGVTVETLFKDKADITAQPAPAKVQQAFTPAA